MAIETRATTASKGDAMYLVGRTEHERRRLIQQAELFGPYTRRFLIEAGIGPHMRVLDVGCGVGDVSLLAASIVGPAGTVVAVDTDPAALALARNRSVEAGIAHVQFRQSDLRDLAVDEPFDAVVGRFVLMYVGDPTTALRQLSKHLRPGGIVAFQEMAFPWEAAAPAMPPSSLHSQIFEWGLKTAKAAGIDLQLGLKLYQTYQAAGLSAPALQGDMLIGGGPDFAGYAYLADLIRSMLPLMECFGVATTAEVGIDTLASRLRDEVVAGGGCIALQLLVGAAARKW